MQKDRAMKCPHCLVAFHEQIVWSDMRSRSAQLRDADGLWTIGADICPECHRSVIYLGKDGVVDGMVRPRAISRSPLPREVTEEFAKDYREACAVLLDSPKASAALGRRCLQHVLREKGRVNPSNLSGEIQQVLDTHALPADLGDDLDAVRNIGNFAAHPIKSTNTGEIVEVEPGEAEWTLDVLETLFDFYFVRPARSQAKRDALNKKLTEAGKPEMKRVMP